MDNHTVPKTSVPLQGFQLLGRHDTENRHALFRLLNNLRWGGWVVALAAMGVSAATASQGQVAIAIVIAMIIAFPASFVSMICMIPFLFETRLTEWIAHSSRNRWILISLLILVALYLTSEIILQPWFVEMIGKNVRF